MLFTRVEEVGNPLVESALDSIGRQFGEQSRMSDSIKKHVQRDGPDVMSDILLLLLLNTTSRLVSELTECISKGAGDKRGRRGNYKIVGNRDIWRYVEGRGIGWGTWGKHDGHCREFEGGGFMVD